jgi:glycosyltransferase involved in cell wall biosynthesis
MEKRGFLLNYFFSKADYYVRVSPIFEELYRQSQLPSNRLKQIPNGVDTKLFHPAMAGEKEMLRNQLGLPEKMKLILFVGHFSHEKSPDILLEAWKQHVAEKFPDTGIIFIGSTNPDHYEVDSELVNDILQQAQPFINERIFFIGKTQEIDKVYKAVDMIVLPSLREGLSNSLLESMACRLPVVVSHLEGITDWVVTDGVNGLLVEPANRNDLGNAMMHILDDDVLAKSLGQEARETIVERFSIQKVAQDYLQLYDELTS